MPTGRLERIGLGAALGLLILFFGIWLRVDMHNVHQSQDDALDQGRNIGSTLQEQGVGLEELSAKLNELRQVVNEQDPLTLVQVQGLLEDLGKKVEGLAESIPSELKGDYLVIQGRIKGLEDKVDALMVGLDGRLDNLEGQVGELPAVLQELQAAIAGLQTDFGGFKEEVREALATPIPTPTPQPTSTTTIRPQWTPTPTATARPATATPTPTPAPRTTPELLYSFSVVLSSDKKDTLLTIEGIKDWWSHLQCPGERDPVESQEHKQVCLAPWNEADDWLEEFPTSHVPLQQGQGHLNFFLAGEEWGVYKYTFLQYDGSWPYPSWAAGPEPLFLVEFTYPNNTGNAAITTIRYRDATSSWPRPRCPGLTENKAVVTCVHSRSTTVEWLQEWVPGLLELPEAGTYAVFPVVALLE